MPQPKNKQASLPLTFSVTSLPKLEITLRRVSNTCVVFVIGGSVRYAGRRFTRADAALRVQALERNYAVSIVEEDGRQ